MSTEVSEDKKFYDDAKKHWEAIPPTVDGMLGGFAKISPTDINGSREFLRPFLTVSLQHGHGLHYSLHYTVYVYCSIGIYIV